MPKHKVTLTFDVPYYGDVEVESPTPAEARAIVRRAINEGREILHPLFKEVRMEPDIFNAGLLSITIKEEYQPPVRGTGCKAKKKPTFRNKEN